MASSTPSGTKICPTSPSPLVMQCQSIVLTSSKEKAAAKAVAAAAAAARAKGETPAISSDEALTPADLQSAYGIASAAASDGYGKTVAIVDAYYDPTIVSDVAAYRTNFGLPACDSNSTYPTAGCVTVYNENGTPLAGNPAADPPQSPQNDDWVPETSLDVEMVSAICPNCTIDLIEASSDAISDLGKAEDEAVSLNAKFVSNSWNDSDTDFPGEAAYDAYFNHPGVAISFASGDIGYRAAWPASSQFVTSVGGTSLSYNGTSWTSSVWNDSSGATGSGCSAGEPQPSWGPDSTDNTASTQCANRTLNDVSADAGSAGGTDVYYSSDSQAPCVGYCALEGTSVATPIITAMYALAGTPAANTYPASYLYANPSDLTQVNSGSNGSCESARQYLCNAADSLSTPYAGYNGPAGLGTPNGNLTPFTETSSDVVSIANPGTTDIQQGASVTIPVKAIDSAGHSLTYSAGLPAGLSINSATGVISGKATFVENDTIKVTATDGTASASVYFRLPSSASLTADYHAGTGYVESFYAPICLDDTGNSSNNGSKIQIWQCTSNDASQQWSFQPSTAPGVVADAGLSQLGTVDIHGKCLNVVGNGTANGSKLQLWSCNGGSNELWEITGSYDDLYNPASGKCVDDPYNSTKNGTQLDIWSCNDQPWQGWFLPGSPFESAVADRCIADGSSANGSGVNSSTCTGAADEKLQIDYAGPYALPMLNGKCLNAEGNGTNDGTVIQLYTCADSSNDVYSANLWYLTAYGQLENAQAQKCLAIPGNTANNNTRLQLQDCYGEPGEVWSAS